MTKLLFAGTLEIFGPHHVVIQIATILSVSAVAVLLFLLLRKRIGGPAAAGPSLLVLFLGSSPVVLQTDVMVFAQATAAGLGALLALERRSGRGDLVACCLLVLGAASFSAGIAFAVGAAALIAAQGGLVRRSWVFIVPGLLYLGWYAWARQFDQPFLVVESNLLLLPNYAADSLAAATGALAGLNVNLYGTTGPAAVGLEWGRVVAAACVIAIIFGIRRSGVTPMFLAVTATAIVLWLFGAINLGPFRSPDAARYLYPYAVLVVLALAEAYRTRTPSSATFLTVAVLVLFALPGNVFQFREEGRAAAVFSEATNARLGMFELERAVIDPALDGGITLPITAARLLRGRRPLWLVRLDPRRGRSGIGGGEGGGRPAAHADSRTGAAAGRRRASLPQRRTGPGGRPGRAAARRSRDSCRFGGCGEPRPLLRRVPDRGRRRARPRPGGRAPPAGRCRSGRPSLDCADRATLAGQRLRSRRGHLNDPVPESGR